MKILIVEDEYETAELLKKLIEFYPTYDVVNICDSIEAAVAYLLVHQLNLDLIFMDIQLSDGQSFEIFDKIAVHLPVVFCTSYDQYTLKAFKNHGIDYILKPFNKNDIQQAIAKVEEFKGSFTAHSLQNINLKNEVAKELPEKTEILLTVELSGPQRD